MAPPLSRTWYDALIDDTGDGMSGTVWNKAQVDGLLDTVDASLAPVVVNPSPVDLTINKIEARVILERPGTTIKARLMGAVADWVGLTINANYSAGTGWQRDDAARAGLALSMMPESGLNLQRHDGTSTTIFRVMPTGMVEVFGGQLHFPAVQLPSTDANTLDDYREHDWTPTISGTSGGSGQTYVAQRGVWQKIGRWVTASFEVGLSAAGTIGGNVVIGNLPLPTDGVNYFVHTCPVLWNTTSAAFVSMLGQLEPSLPSSLRLYGLKTAQTSAFAAPIVAGDLTSTTTFYGVIRYRTLN